MYDLKIIYPDGSIGAVEITAAHDDKRIELWREVRKRATLRQEPSLAGGWLVRILPSAQARELDKRLSNLLHELERDGRKAIRGAKTSTDRQETLAGALGIIEALQSSTDRPGSIYVMPPEGSREQMGGYSPTTGDPLAAWIGEWLVVPSRADNVQKLTRSDAREKHIFMLVPGFSPVPFAVMDLLATSGAPLPTVAPVLPPEITHVWAMSMWIQWGDGFRWSPDRGWSRFTKVEPPN
jgi:hypothetical protein